MSSESAKTFGFMMRPAVFSGYSSSSPTSAPAGFFCISSRTCGGELLGQVIDDGRRIVGRQLLRQLDDLLGRSPGEQRGGSLRPQLAEGFHRQAAVALDQERKR